MIETSVKSIAKLARASQQLACQAHREYTREVDAVIHERCRDPKRIERLLDGMLDFCFDSKMLRLYKKLCRYYSDIDPAATVTYVHAYREIWDEDENDTLQ